MEKDRVFRVTRAGFVAVVVAVSMLACARPPAVPGAPAASDAAASVYAIEEGFVDVSGVFIYYKALGRGEPR